MARSARRSERGAALVEAIVIAPVLMMLFAGLLFVAYMYSQKLTTQGEARAAAWTYALGSCSGGGGQTRTTDGANLDAVTTDEEAPPDSQLPEEGRTMASEAAGGGELEFGDSWGVGEASSVRDGRSFLAFSSGSITSSRQVQCDEKPRGADPVAVLSFLWTLHNTFNFTN